jgi:3-oxoacyl-[acyl-carrier protein] reductase
VATATLFLIRDADYMTGSVLKMDGGVTLGSQKVPPMPTGILK